MSRAVGYATAPSTPRLAMLNSFDGLLWFVLAVLALLFLQRALHHEIQAVILLLTHFPIRQCDSIAYVVQRPRRGRQGARGHGQQAWPRRRDPKRCPQTLPPFVRPKLIQCIR